MSHSFIFLLMCLASYSITRVVTKDSFPPSQWFRKLIGDRFSYDGSLFDLITCPWCFGMYITAALFAICCHLFSIPLPVLQAIAARTIVGMIGNFDG